MKNYKWNRIAACCICAGVICLGLVFFTTVFAFSQVGSGLPDKNVVNVDPQVERTEDKTDKIEQGEFTNVEVTVFSATFINNFEQVVIKSNNGDRVVAPGAQDTGDFIVKNTSPYKIRCYCEFIGQNDEGVPVNVQLLDSTGQYIVGSSSEYVNPVQLNGIVKSYEMVPGQVVNFSLPWKWLFETKDEHGSIKQGDKRDTGFGNAAMDHDIIVKVGIRTACEIIEDEGSGPAQTNDLLIKLILILGAVLVLAGLTLWYVVRRKKNIAAASGAQSNNNADSNSYNFRV